MPLSDYLPILMIPMMAIAMITMINVVVDEIQTETDVDNMVNGKLLVVSELRTMTIESEIQGYSYVTNQVVLTFENDLDNFYIYDLTIDQHNLLTKMIDTNVEIQYEMLYGDFPVFVSAKSIDENVGDDISFNIWIFVAAAMIPPCMIMLFKLYTVITDHRSNRPPRPTREEKKEEKQKKQIEQEKKEQEKIRKSYKKPGRSSRTCKAAQLLDEKENKKKRR